MEQLQQDNAVLMEIAGMGGEICYNCHSNFMVKVQLKYHWRDFSELEVDDPVSGENIMFTHFKHGMVANLD